MRTEQRIKALEARNSPGIPPEAMIIPVLPGEKNEAALARFWIEQGKLWDAQAPRIYLTLNREAPA